VLAGKLKAVLAGKLKAVLAGKLKAVLAGKLTSRPGYHWSTNGVPLARK
jgi:hypothetical protein